MGLSYGFKPASMLTGGIPVPNVTWTKNEKKIMGIGYSKGKVVEGADGRQYVQKDYGIGPVRAFKQKPMEVYYPDHEERYLVQGPASPGSRRDGSSSAWDDTDSEHEDDDYGKAGHGYRNVYNPMHSGKVDTDPNWADTDDHRRRDADLRGKGFYSAGHKAGKSSLERTLGRSLSDLTPPNAQPMSEQ